jgi:hypothetical protein
MAKKEDMLSDGEALAVKAIKIIKYQKSLCHKDSLMDNDCEIVLKALRKLYMYEVQIKLKKKKEEKEHV